MALLLGVGALLRRIVLFSRTRSLPGQSWLEGLSFAALWGVPFVFFMALGLQLTSAAHAFAIVLALLPIFAGLIRWRALREPPGGLRRPGHLVIICGW
jgi:drug/metabolite transporter (DMT)-like permease